MKTPRSIAGLAGLALLVSAPLGAQNTPPPTIPDSVQELAMEFQQLQAQLQQAQTEAIQGDTALQTEQQELEETVKDAIIEMDSTLESKIDSLPELQQEAMAAQQAGDTAQFQNLMTTGQRIQGQIQQAQQAVLEQEEVAEQVEAFQERLMAAMEEIDPEIESVVDRLEVLSTRLQAFQSGG